MKIWTAGEALSWTCPADLWGEDATAAGPYHRKEAALL